MYPRVYPRVAFLCLFFSVPLVENQSEVKENRTRIKEMGVIIVSTTAKQLRDIISMRIISSFAGRTAATRLQFIYST